jgi:hypothetical protein
MLVRLKLTGSRRQIFHTNEYILGPVKEMHPDILEVTVTTDDGKKKIAHAKRPNPKYYEKYEYKPLPPAEPPQDPIAPDLPEEPTRSPDADPQEGTAQ